MLQQPFSVSPRLCDPAPGTGTVPQNGRWLGLNGCWQGGRPLSWTCPWHWALCPVCFSVLRPTCCQEGSALAWPVPRAPRLAPRHGCPPLSCLRAGGGTEVRSLPRGGSRDLCPARREGFTFSGSSVGQAICLNNPRGNHLAKLLVSKQFTSLVFKQTPAQALCLVPGRGLASLLPGPAQRPAPTPGDPTPGCRSHLPTNNPGGCPDEHLPTKGPRPVVLPSQLPPLAWPWMACPTPLCWAPPAQTFRQTGQAVALSWGSCSLHFCRQSSNKNLKGSAAQGNRRHPPAPALESINTYRFIPAFNYCLSHRDLILMNADNGVP